jgi:Ni/Fe-hydrogenase 1 B-type cytochrome subunit
MRATIRRWREQEAGYRPARFVVYVWELPVRVTHWVVVGSLLVLMLTGYYVHHPFIGAKPGTGPGHPGFTMGLDRAIHEAAGFVFLAALLFRMYWAFVGNRYAHWRALLPITPRQRSDLAETARYYAFLQQRPPRTNGHNPMAGLSYIILYLGFALAILTGLGLFAEVLRRPPWTTFFGWTYGVVGVSDLRLIHFMLMFGFIAFAIHHVYSAVLFDIEERNGELSSIVTGWKADMEFVETPSDVPPQGDMQYESIPSDDPRQAGTAP